MASPITFGGLASGIDTNSIIAKLVEVERRPIVQLQQQKQDQGTQKGIVDDLTGKLGSLSTAMLALNTQAAVQGRSVIVTGGAPFTATVAGGAPLGTYGINVTQLAKAQRTYSASFAGANSAGIFGAGAVTLAIGASNATINVDGTDTLSTVANKINAAGLRASAAVIYDGTNYRLVVNGLDSGAANAITFSDPAHTGLQLDAPANTLVSAQDALLTIDGLNVHSASNTVASSIPGVSLTLSGLGAGTASVNSDPTQLKTALKAIVDAYNAAESVVAKQFPQSGKPALGGNTLVGDSTIRQLQQTLFGLPSVAGGPAGNAYTSLSEIGISVDRYGTMSLNDSQLQRALNTNPSAVANLLAGTTPANGLMKQLSNSLTTFTDFVNGLLPSKSKSIDTSMHDLDNEIARRDLAATAYEQGLRQQFTAMEQMIASFNTQGGALSQLTNQTSSSSSGK